MKTPHANPPKRRNGVAQAALGRKPTKGHKRKERSYNLAKGHTRKAKHPQRPETPHD